jgi:hypothetical protein
MADQNLSVDIKIKADTSGAKEAEKAIDGLTQAIEEQAVAEKELVQETEKVVVEEKKLVEVEKEVEKVVEKTTAAKRKKKEATKEQKKEDEAAVVETQKVIEAEKKEIAVTEELTTAKKRKTKATEQQNVALNNATVTGNGATQTKREMAKAAKDLEKQTTRSAMGFMALSNAFQDVQYGMAGMINNIPGIITGMGLGMGVAGTVQIAAVGLQVLLKNVDLFGETAKQAARDAADLAAETMADADAAYKNAKATEAATEAQERHNEAMQAAEERYKEQIKLSEDLLRQKQAERDAVIAMTDAQAGLDMAKIQLAEGRGEMSKEDAIIAKEKVRAEAEARKRAAEVAVEAERVADMDRKARAEALRGNAILTEAEKLKTEGAGMMTKEDRELAGKNKGSAQTQLDSSKLRQEALAKEVTADQKAVDVFDPLGVINKPAVARRLAENRAKLAKEQEEAAKLQADINREDEKIKKDKEARLKTGIKDGDARDLEKSIEEKTKQGKAAYSSAHVIWEDRNEMIRGFEQSQKLFDVRQQTGATQAQVQVEAEQRRRQEEARREEERAAAEKERKDADRAREVAQVGTAGGSLASTLAGDKFPSSFTDSLREAAGGAGDAAGLDRLIAMVAKLAANSSKLSEQAKSKLDKLESEIEDLRTAK